MPEKRKKCDPEFREGAVRIVEETSALTPAPTRHHPGSRPGTRRYTLVCEEPAKRQ